MSKILEIEKLEEILNREELFATWTFFEEKYSFFDSIIFHSRQTDLETKTLGKVIAFVIQTATVDTYKMMNKLPHHKANDILTQLYSKGDVSLETMRKILEHILDGDIITKLRESLSSFLINCIAVRKYDDSIGDEYFHWAEMIFTQICENVWIRYGIGGVFFTHSSDYLKL